jgi:two-component sensor histidine kinase
MSGPTASPPLPFIDREADHRIANSLGMIASLVRVCAARGHAADPKILLAEVADRIDTVARLHRLLAASDSDLIELPVHLREICDLLSASVAGIAPMVSVTHSAAQMVPWKTARPIGLIVAELVSNSIKFAHPTCSRVKIAIDCQSDDDGGLTLCHEDDGVGFPEDFDPGYSGHMGIGLIRILAGELNATSDWTTASPGVRFAMVVPAPVERC